MGNIPHKIANCEISKDVFLSNNLVNSHNSLVYNQSGMSKRFEVKAWDVVLGEATPQVKGKVLKAIPLDASKTMGLYKCLQLALGLRAELSTNVNVEDELANGASCVIKCVNKSIGNSLNGCIWVQFDNNIIGAKCRREKQNLYSENISRDWTPIIQVKNQCPVGRYRSVEVLRTQYPLRAASAKTLHRCQGDTMTTGVIDMSGRGFVHDHYVALSRFKCLNNVYLLELNERNVSLRSAVQSEMTRLQNNMLLISDLTFMDTEDQSKFTIFFRNVRSLKKHIVDIRMDQTSDIFFFVESNLTQSVGDSDISIQGYNLKRFDWNSSGNTAYGIAVYSHVHLNAESLYSHKSTNKSGTVIECVLLILHNVLTNSSVQIVGLYSSSKTNITEWQSFMDSLPIQAEIPVIILGDFNRDLLRSSKCNIFSHDTKNIRQIINKCTTYYDSLLDNVYTDLSENVISAGVFESYFSDHKPIWGKIQKDVCIKTSEF